MALVNVGTLVNAGVNALFDKGRGAQPTPYGQILTDNSATLFGGPSKSAFYTVNAKDWYQTFPYRFVIKSKNKAYTYALPIPPQAFSFAPMIPSQATATLGGVVEETSPVVFWSVGLQGTFGQAISKQSGSTPAGREDEFRRVFTAGGTITKLLSGVTNLAQNVAGVLSGTNPLELLGNATVPYSSSYVNADSPASQGLIGDIVSSVKAIAGGNKPTPGGGLTTTGGNGFTEVHAFQNFLLAYQSLKSARPDEFSLYFQSLKDGIEWRCVLAGPPQFSKNAGKPFLYDYNISLRCWDLQPVNASDRKPIDRFGPGGDLSDVTSGTATGALTSVANARAAISKTIKNPASLFKPRGVG